MKISINKLCQKVILQPKPLIFLDTCTILDIINSLHSHSLPHDYINHALNLIQLHKDNAVYLMTAENVRQEYDENIDSVEQTAKTEIARAMRQIETLLEIHNLISASSLNSHNVTSFNLPAHAKRIAKSLLDSCNHINRKKVYSVRAMDRIRGNIAPAKQGGGEAKDCEIIECFLDITRELRRRDFTELIVFMTANTNDYGKAGQLRSPLDNEFLESRAMYINHFNHLINVCDP